MAANFSNYWRQVLSVTWTETKKTFEPWIGTPQKIFGALFVGLVVCFFATFLGKDATEKIYWALGTFGCVFVLCCLSFTFHLARSPWKLETQMTEHHAKLVTQLRADQEAELETERSRSCTLADQLSDREEESVNQVKLVECVGKFIRFRHSLEDLDKQFHKNFPNTGVAHSHEKVKREYNSTFKAAVLTVLSNAQEEADKVKLKPLLPTKSDIEKLSTREDIRQFMERLFKQFDDIRARLNSM